MKIIISEEQLKKIILREQWWFEALSNLNDVADGGEALGNIGGLSWKDTGCEIYKTAKEALTELFMYSRKTKNQPKTSDKNIMNKIGLLQSGMSTENVLSTIVTLEELGAVLNGYNKKYGYALSSTIDEEESKKIWKKLRVKLNKGIVDVCKKRKGGSVVNL